jgi:NRAMP (natural resistance-associated macrophage protein)-like metal ion transporter
MANKVKGFGPGAMIAAAFIGPGTVTTATLAGGNFGFTLLWAIGFSVIATLTLQEMTARLGAVAQVGLGEAIAARTNNTPLRWPAALLVIAAIVVGNAAYEAGNITGASAGLPGWTLSAVNIWPLIIGLAAYFILNKQGSHFLEQTLGTLVVAMALVFVGTALYLQPSVLAIARGLFVPSIPENASLLVLGIIGTTVVPYNLYLHASVIKRHSKEGMTLAGARRDILVSVVGGGVITLCIAVTAAVVMHGAPIKTLSFTQLAPTLAPVLGPASPLVLGIGFFAAGLSSAITAPLAAAYAVTEVLNLDAKKRDRAFKWTWRLVLAFGVIVASLSLRPIELIVFAQFTNGILLPITAAFIVWIANDQDLLGKHRNTPFNNAMGLFVLTVTCALGLRSVLMASGWL